jgi:hypothetical protein
VIILILPEWPACPAAGGVPRRDAPQPGRVAFSLSRFSAMAKPGGS